MALDLTRSRFTGPLLKNPRWQNLASWGFVFGLLALIAAAWGRERLPGVPEPFPLLYTHVTTLLFWVVWFMGIVLLAPVVGRAWCSVCPLGLISNRLGRKGLGLAWPGGLWRWLGVFAVFLAGVTAALFLDAHKSPHYTALLVAAMMGFAALTGLVWRRAAFCRLFCPVGTVLTIYGRFAPLRVAARDPQRCDACSSHGCTSRDGGWKRWDLGNLVIHKKVQGSGCPVALHPPTMDAAECLLCLECVRRCPEDNLGVFLGRRVSERPLPLASTLLLIPLAGLVCLALVRTWPVFRDTLTPGAFPPVWAWAAWFGLLLPALFVLAAPVAEWFTTRAAGRDQDPPAPGQAVGHAPQGAKGEEFWALAGRISAPLAGPVLGAHLALALVKLNAKAAYVPYLFYDPLGASTYLAINTAGTLPQPGLVIPLGVLGPIALALLFFGIFMGMLDARRVWRAPLGSATRALASVMFVALSSLYGALLYHWLLGGR